MAKPVSIPKKELQWSVVVIALIIGAFVLSPLVLFTPYWFVWPAILLCSLFTIGCFSASKHPYQCPSCKNTFKITVLQDFFAPHGVTKGSNWDLFEWKLLKYPECNKREKCYRVENQ